MPFKKRTDKYYHLTCWSPESIPVGRPIYTPHNESNYWKKHSNIDELTKLIALDTKQHPLFKLLNDENLEKLAISKAKAESAKESLLEDIRLDSFPHLPSRRRCIFLCESEEQLNIYLEKYQFPRKGRVVLELETIYFDPVSEECWTSFGLTEKVFRQLNECRRFRANPKFLNCNSLPLDEKKSMLQRYWLGQETSSEHLTEVLYEGFYRVTRIIQ